MLSQIRQYREAFQQCLKQVYAQVVQREPLLAQMRRQLTIPDIRIWFCFVGSTLVWATYLITVYALPSLACQWQWIAVSGTSSGLKLLQMLISIVAAGLITSVGYVVFVDWQHVRKAGYNEFSQAQAAHLALLAFVTLLLNTLYLLMISLALVPIVVLAVCG